MNKLSFALTFALIAGTAVAQPPPLKLGIGGVFKVYDANNAVIGQAGGPLDSGAMTAMFRTQGHAFSACWYTDGFWGQTWEYFATPNCTGQAYSLQFKFQPTIICGEYVIGATGGFISFPDTSKPTSVIIQSGGLINADGLVGACNPSVFGPGILDAFTTIAIPTFTLPFRNQ